MVFLSVCLSVRPSVRLYNADIVLKQLYTVSLFQLSGRDVLLIYFASNRHYRVPRGIPKRGALNTRRSRKKLRLSSEIALYLEKGTR